MKKIISVILAIGLTAALPVFASAYDTDLEYSVEVNREIDVDLDGEMDGTITDETPYLLMVPDKLVVDGDSDKVYIGGIVDSDVVVSAPESVDMLDDVKNAMAASVEMDGGTLTLVHSVTDVTYANTDIRSFWGDSAPITGQWTGNFVYTVS